MNGLSEDEKKFLKMVYNYACGHTSKRVVSGELYQLAGKNKFNDHDVHSLSQLLSKLGFLEMETLGDEKTATGAPVVFYIRLTSEGASYARNIE